MEADVEASSSPKTGVTAAPLTAVIAQRVRHLRQQADMRGAALAAKLNDLGIPWNRSTVAKFETGQRASISVQELLALAVALDVPPIWLLADVDNGSPTPIASGLDEQPWETLLWLVGRQPLRGGPGAWWLRVAPSLGLIYTFRSALEQVQRNRFTQLAVASDPELAEHMDSEDELAEKDRRALLALASSMTSIQRSGFALPTVPDDVLARAAELHVELPSEDI
jgi:transcriptional regulator with XRE-family HTH domain